MKFRKTVLAAGLVLTIIISDTCSFIRDGRKLEELRNNVIRLHILADSDSVYDQEMKLKVRDALLDADIFDDYENIEEAEEKLRKSIPEIISVSEKTLRKNGCFDEVTAEIEDTFFDERVYGDITMPEGNYRALRVKIGSAKGHNWWCVMYPPLCIPAACNVESDNDKAEELFDEKENDILFHPKKYRVRFALWDEVKKLSDIHFDFVQNDEKQENT